LFAPFVCYLFITLISYDPKVERDFYFIEINHGSKTVSNSIFRFNFLCFRIVCGFHYFNGRLANEIDTFSRFFCCCRCGFKSFKYLCLQVNLTQRTFVLINIVLSFLVGLRINPMVSMRLLV